MTSRQLNSRNARRTRPGFFNLACFRLKNFAGKRAREAGYGVFFTSVFLMCQSSAYGLALDDIRVLSRLGQPLVAEVLVSHAAGEALSSGCFRTMRPTGDLPGVGAVRLTLTRSLDSNILRVAGTRPMREPLSEFVLQVKCPGVPTMVKTFLVMVDPPALNEPIVYPATSSTTVSEVTQARRTQNARSRRDTIPPGSQYTVRSGDMLSTIASRVSGRPDWSVWPIAQHIYAGNPGAFLLGNPNIIAEGAVIFIPRLADVDMSATTRPAIAPAANPAPAAAAIPASKPVATTMTQPTAAPAVARIMPTPTVVAAPTVPLPAMQLTTRLLRESQVKILLRAQGSPVAPAVIAQNPAGEVPVSSTPEPTGEPDRPDSAATSTRAALQPGETATQQSSLNWLWTVVGLLTGLLFGALAAVGLFRQNLRREYEHDLREGVQRQVHTDRLRQQRDQAESSSSAAGQVAGVGAATMDLSSTVETPATADDTIEMSTAEGLDLEFSNDEPATVGEPETIEMPGVASDLDLELPAETGKTGQHEVDFDLLEAAYSEDYQAEFVNPTAKTDTADAGDSADGTDQFYHLENRDPTDETPLSIEFDDDDDESDSSNDDGKVVRFRR